MSVFHQDLEAGNCSINLLITFVNATVRWITIKQHNQEEIGKILEVQLQHLKECTLKDLETDLDKTKKITFNLNQLSHWLKTQQRNNI
jgi:hypothetical protein